MRTRGYTLLEMVIVTAIIASLVALAFPAMNSSLGTGELGDAAKRVRNALAKARLQAIESGRPYRFRFQPGGREFELGPKPTLSSGTGLTFTSQRMTVSAGVASDDSSGGRADEDQPVQHELPDGARFGSLQSTERPEPEPLSYDSGATARLDAHRWSTPIVFYPDGRTSNARIRLLGLRNTRVDVRLRGLTGTVTIGPVVRVKMNRTTSPPLDEGSGLGVQDSGVQAKKYGSEMLTPDH